MIKGDIPVGFAMSLAQDPEAMQKFSSLDEQTQQQILERVHTASSKEEMRNLVSSITTSY